MKKELEQLIATDGAELAINGIFSLRRELCRDEITSRDIDNIYLYCRLPGFPAVWSERIVSREYAALVAEVEETMRSMMTQATEQLTTRFRAGKI